MRRSYDETATLLALLLHRFGKTRCRVSKKTFEVISQRARLHRSFIELVRVGLEDLGVVLFDLERGGFALVAASALEGAPPASSKLITADLMQLRTGKMTFEDILTELGFDDEDEENDD